MARLRRAGSVAKDALPVIQEPNDCDVEEEPTIARAAFANTTNLHQPFTQQITGTNCDDMTSKTITIPSNAPKPLICKKVSPRKDARKQIHLKPMGFAKQDEDLSVLMVPIERDEVKQRPKRDIYSPIKLAASRLPSNTSFESMISDHDDGSDFSLPTSMVSEDSVFELTARIPDSLISPTKRQLFSPAKRKPVTNADIDDIAFGLAATKLEEVSAFEPDFEGSIHEPISSYAKGLSNFKLGMPTLLPSSQSSDDGDLPMLRPSTPPPSSPSKSKLVSPSKIKCRIPTPPPRSSPNAFWSVEKVNDWNEQHSPQKIVRSPKKSRFLQLDETTSPSGSPQKRSSPTKPSREALAVKRDFEARKKDVAVAFLAELDATITEGQIAALSESTGGVQLIWSKTLNSTAGRANWKKETTKSRGAEKPAGPKHFASIELAEKVIDDETRLLNVLAHEFCHLANFMVSGIKDRPHGAEFKSWGKKCTLAFGDRGVEVTTKHTYDIDYKYIWECTNDDCLAEFKRHSKSIDPSRHTCGVCRAKLIQVKPVPRKVVEGVKPAGYAAFVKEHYAAVKQEMPGASQKEIMTRIGERYRAAKAESVQASHHHKAEEEHSVDGVTKEIEMIALDETAC